MFDNYAANDTIPDLLYKVYDYMYQSRRQTNVPCYAYSFVPLQASYLYVDNGCIDQLVFKHIGDSIDIMLNAPNQLFLVLYDQSVRILI